ncbi:hypothetical protein [Halorussus litoreus]|uniref:hypothetical protein n=1 Tax=Halorussus litoreus TaxID=1710536 RepID=UPI000E232F8D|nr:hypothetical protein [Halorussus litoreus]
MTIAEDMCSITSEHAGRKLRYFVRADPENGNGNEGDSISERDLDSTDAPGSEVAADQQIEVLHLREDLDWTRRRQREVESELLELVASESYEALMNAENVNQIIKVADDKILFTGFVDDEVVVASFERGILPVLPTVVDEFRSYMRERDVSFISLDM